jgi:hypothetical protein
MTKGRRRKEKSLDEKFILQHLSEFENGTLRFQMA